MHVDKVRKMAPEFLSGEAITVHRKAQSWATEITLTVSSCQAPMRVLMARSLPYIAASSSRFLWMRHSQEDPTSWANSTPQVKHPRPDNPWCQPCELSNTRIGPGKTVATLKSQQPSNAISVMSQAQQGIFAKQCLGVAEQAIYLHRDFRTPFWCHCSRLCSVNPLCHCAPRLALLFPCDVSRSGECTKVPIPK